MKPVVVSARAARDVGRLEDWLKDKKPNAAVRAVMVIREAIASLALLPERSAKVGGTGQRELVRRFGKGGYVVRYVVLPDMVVVTGVWHTLEDRPDSRR